MITIKMFTTKVFTNRLTFQCLLLPINSCHSINSNSSPTASINTLSVLKNNGLDPQSASKYPKIMYIKPGELDQNLKLLRLLNLDNDAIIRISLENQSFVWKCFKMCKNDLLRHKEHRIHFLSRELQISHEELCSKLVKYKFVANLSMDRITNIVKVLKEYKVEPSDIISDMWILRCRAELVSSRLKQVQELEVEVVKPWMGRCRSSVFERFIKRASSKQKLLGELSLEEYISQRLGFPSEEIEKVVKREPQLQRASVLKIKKILDFLLLNGFSADHILAKLSRVANRRIETIHSRLQELNQLGVAPSLYILCKSQKEYQEYINKRKKRLKTTN